MKFRFQAVNESGNAMRGVMRADSEDDARQRLLAQNIFPKHIEPAPEDEKITWASRSPSEIRPGSSWRHPGPTKVDMPQGTRLLEAVYNQHGSPVRGQLGVTPQGKVGFRSKDGETEFWLEREDVEGVYLRGFPFRQLQIVRVDGDDLLAPAGFLFPAPLPKELLKKFSVA